MLQTRTSACCCSKRTVLLKAQVRCCICAIPGRRTVMLLREKDAWHLGISMLDQCPSAHICRSLLFLAIISEFSSQLELPFNLQSPWTTHHRMTQKCLYLAIILCWSSSASFKAALQDRCSQAQNLIYQLTCVVPKTQFSLYQRGTVHYPHLAKA